MISRGFQLPAPPWPEHTAAIDSMLFDTRQECFTALMRKKRYEAAGSKSRIMRNYRTLDEASRQEIIDAGYSRSAYVLAQEYGVSERTIHALRKEAGMSRERYSGDVRRLRRRRQL